MAEQSGIFPSVNGDRKYFTSFFAEYFADFISNGIYPNPSTQCQVLANNNMTVILKPGNGYINGFKYINDSDKVLDIDTADGVLKRIDRIVLRHTVLNREIKAYVKKGTFASSPVAPSLQRDADMWELGVADIYIANGAVNISKANITDLRLNTDLCGIVHGLVIQVDTTTIFNQFQAWYAETIDDATTDIETMLSAFQSSFNSWLTNLQDILDENVGGNLLNEINALILRMIAAETAISNLKKFQTAGGTANAITLTNIEVTDGFQTSFIIANSNNGTATTINAKPLYKPGTTTAPKLVAGKAATVWYNLTGDCFFIKASAEGTAVAGDVLAGKTFSNDDDTGITGAMPNRGAVTITPGTVNQVVLDGYHNGSGYVVGDADLIASNILSGKNIFGVNGNVYEPATTAAYSLMTNLGGTDYPFGINQFETFCQSEVQQLTYKKYGQRINMKASGTVRIKFTLVPTLVNYLGQVFARIYKNGAPLGLERASVLNNMSNQTFMEDFTVSKGDYLEFYLKTSNNAGAYGKVTSLLLGFNKESLIALV